MRGIEFRGILVVLIFPPESVHESFGKKHYIRLPVPRILPGWCTMPIASR